MTRTGGQISCADATAGRVEIGMWTDRLKAVVPLTIDGVRVTGGGARVVGVVATTARKPRLSLAGISDWPPTKMSADFDWKARTDLVGLHLGAGEEIVPVLHVVARRGSRLDGLEVTYSVD
ncbi:MAG: hypothetical protein JWQ74_568 [Marmoricola sp.]|nr:hypothetical protein [Marmoricola sp.]